MKTDEKILARLIIISEFSEDIKASIYDASTKNNGYLDQRSKKLHSIDSSIGDIELALRDINEYLKTEYGFLHNGDIRKE